MKTIQPLHITTFLSNQHPYNKSNLTQQVFLEYMV
jgi:hypothetical protein